MNPIPPQTFHVQPEQVNQAILSGLRQWLPGVSWNQLRKLMAARYLQVSGNLCLDEGRRLRLGEVVKILPHPAAAPPRSDDVRVQHVDSQLVVVEKPAGMTTLRHPEERNLPKQRRQLQPTLDELLAHIVQKVQKGGQPPRGVPRRLRPVHRLDRETSGLMVFARTPVAERDLGQQFRAHSIHRVYLAIVVGHITAQTIESWLVRDRGDGRRGSSPDRKGGAGGKHAVTHVRPLEHVPGYTLVECRLETGRTHQIRIHLSERGHPLCGDKVYRGPYPGKPIADHSRAPRVALHAAELGFLHPTTEAALQFAMPFPPDLAEVWQRLGGHVPELPTRADSAGRPAPPRAPRGKTPPVPPPAGEETPDRPRQKPGRKPQRPSASAAQADGQRAARRPQQTEQRGDRSHSKRPARPPRKSPGKPPGKRGKPGPKKPRR